MDSNAIKEISSQLGVSADYLLNHLSEFAPNWTAMQVAKNSVTCVFIAVALCVTVFALTLAVRSMRNGQTCNYYGYELDLAVVTLGLVAIFLFAFLGTSATNIATHIASPEAAMVNDVLEAMKR